MTIGELLELLEAIFAVIAEYLGKLFGDGETEEGDETTTA